MSEKVYKENTRSYKMRFLVLAVLFVVVFLGSFCLGRYYVPPLDLIKIALSQVLPIEQTWADSAVTVLLARMPRIFGAVLIGSALSVAGAAYQGMFQNPMVSPDILGASSGAGFGAALGIFFSFGYISTSLLSFVLGLSAVLLAYAISRASRTNGILAMVLAGMVISSLCSSGVSFLKLVADTEEVLPAITYWLMGSLASLRMDDKAYGLAAIVIIVSLIPLLCLRWRINLLTAGEDEARSMGINVTALRVVIIISATLMTASAVSVSGIIGWIGLVIPHFCRMIFGYDYRRIIPAAILMGSTFLLIVDDFARTLTTGEIPLGILTAFVGAPVFLYLLLTGGLNRES